MNLQFWKKNKKLTLYESDFWFYQFLAQFDPESFSLNWDSEEEYIQESIDTNFVDWKTVERGRQLIASANFPWKEIINATHYYRDSPEAVRQWFTHLIDMIETQLKSGDQS